MGPVCCLVAETGQGSRPSDADSVLQTVDAILTVDAIICNQAFQNGRCYICFSLGLGKHYVHPASYP